MTPHATSSDDRDDARRSLGAYYTPTTAADYIADWALRHHRETVLEPSVGDGTFLRALAASAARRGVRETKVLGVEIDPAAVASALRRGSLAGCDLRCDDFLNTPPTPVQAAVGNPPYVRLRRLSPKHQQRAIAVASRALGQPIDPAASVWMPFILHTLQFLDSGGRLAFVLPYELTYVRYARPLWKLLSEKFGSLSVCRTRERLFPDLMQDVVLLLADDYGSRTDTVRYQAFELVSDLLESRPQVDEHLSVAGLLGGNRSFVKALLGTELRELLDTRVADATVPAREIVTFNIGYVAGDKDFFHPSEQEIKRYGIGKTSLRPAVASARSLRGAGLHTSRLPQETASRLFVPNPLALKNGEKKYVEVGEKYLVHSRYKCRVRDPWYVVPGVRVPDVVVGVFSERPLLLVNDAAVVASNSLLYGYVKGVTGEALATAWYTSLTRLQCELEVHALGGGVMVLVPNEASKIRLPSRVQVDSRHLATIEDSLRSGNAAAAYSLGDDAVLVKQMRLTDDDVTLIRQGAETLARWRTSSRPGPKPDPHAKEAARSLENVPEEGTRVEGFHEAINKGVN